jgi:hypothetical protein
MDQIMRSLCRTSGDRASWPIHYSYLLAPKINDLVLEASYIQLMALETLETDALALCLGIAANSHQHAPGDVSRR